MKEIIERIKDVFEQYGSNANKLASGNSAMQRKISRQLNGAALTIDVVLSVLTAFPDVSPAWLLLGEGSMKVGKEAAPNNKEWEKEKAELLSEIKSLEDQNRLMRELLEKRLGVVSTESLSEKTA